MDNEWALFAQFQRLEAPPSPPPAPLGAAEARRISFEYVRWRLGADAHNLTWREYLQMRPNVFNTHDAEHVCNRATCTQECGPRGVRFQDPMPPHDAHVSTGDVYVCQMSGTVHVCDPATCTLEADSTEDRGTTLCPVSGRFKQSVLSAAESFHEREQRLANPQNRGTKRAHSAPRVSSKRSTSDVAHAQQKREATRICERLVCNGALRRAVIDRVDAVGAELRAQQERAVARRPALDAVRAASIVATACQRAGLWDAVRMLALAPDDWMPPSDATDYLIGAVVALFSIVRSTPEAIDNSKDINLRKMSIALIYMLHRGLVGTIETNLSTGRITNRRAEAADEPDLTAPSRGHAVRRYVFVPAHPGLACLMPRESAIPPMDVWNDELSNLMRRGRRLNSCFLATMRGGASRPEDFCLATRMGSALRTDILTTATRRHEPAAHP